MCKSRYNVSMSMASVTIAIRYIQTSIEIVFRLNNILSKSNWWLIKCTINCNLVSWSTSLLNANCNIKRNSILDFNLDESFNFFVYLPVLQKEALEYKITEQSLLLIKGVYCGTYQIKQFILISSSSSKLRVNFSVTPSYW